MSKSRQSFLEFLIRESAIAFDLNNPDILIIGVRENGNVIKIELSEGQTDLLRLMLYNGYKIKPGSRKEKSARNKVLWALAKQQRESEPGKAAQIIYERLKAEMEQKLEMLPKSGKLNPDDWKFLEIDSSELDIPDYTYDDFFK